MPGLAAAMLLVSLVAVSRFGVDSQTPAAVVEPPTLPADSAQDSTVISSPGDTGGQPDDAVPDMAGSAARVFVAVEAAADPAAAGLTETLSDSLFEGSPRSTFGQSLPESLAAARQAGASRLVHVRVATPSAVTVSIVEPVSGDTIWTDAFTRGSTEPLRGFVSRIEKAIRAASSPDPGGY